MRIVAFGCTHGAHEQVELPPGDVLIHTGDWSHLGSLPEMERFFAWMGKVHVGYERVIIVPGNHDWSAFGAPRTVAELAYMHGLDVLVDQPLLHDDVVFYGSPWTPMFCNWAFMLERGKEIAQRWRMIARETDVLVTHGPPHGILDANVAGVVCGCEELRAAIDDVKPKLHVFSHIHEGYGTAQLQHPYTKEVSTRFANVSIMDEKYKPVNKPMTFDV